MIRVDNETWAAYDEVCKALGTTRTDDIRRHIHRQIAAYRRRQRAESAES
jgi:prophage antirepressor-like protein